MDCPRTHEWFEAARGALPRDRDHDVGRHLADCPDCRDRDEDVREAAASLGRLADATRADLSADAAEALFRRARMHGLLGRKPRQTLGAWAGRSRWVRRAVPLTMAAAAMVLIALGIWTSMPQPVRPEGALQRLVRAGHGLKWAHELRPLGPLARAAVSQELGRPEPSVPQVADLLLVAYIAERPREDRQTQDVHFLLGQIWSRRPRAPTATAFARPFGPMLASTAPAAGLVADAAGRTLRGDFDARPFADAKAAILDGRYDDALDLVSAEGNGAVLKAWCLASLGRKAEAALILSETDEVSGTPMARVLKADLALRAGEVAAAVQQYENLAAVQDRYWFPAGYLYRYELRDGRAAGECWRRVADGQLADYVARTFRAELAMADAPEPEPLVAVDFDDYAAGPLPDTWALVRVRDGEFAVADVPGGRALSQGPGTEFVTGESEWADYTLQMDIKIRKADADYTVGAAAYRRADHTGYVLELGPECLRLVKQMARTAAGAAPLVGQVHRLVIPPAEGWWYTLKIRVQRVDGGVNVAGKVWRTDTDEPLGWQVAWTDTGQADLGPLPGGRAGLQVRGARVLVDNVVIIRDVSSDELPTAAP